MSSVRLLQAYCNTHLRVAWPGSPQACMPIRLGYRLLFQEPKAATGSVLQLR